MGPASRTTEKFGTSKGGFWVGSPRDAATIYAAILHGSVVKRACREVDAVNVSGTFMERCFSCRIDRVREGFAIPVTV
jgi:hypothetical protein